MITVSACCKAPIVQGQHIEYPLSDRWGIKYVVDVCEDCGQEVEETVNLCECCGEVTEEFIETRLGSWCSSCVSEFAESLMERPKEVS